MANVRYASRQGWGDILNLHMDDGSVQMVHAMPNGSWRSFTTSQDGSLPPDPGGGGGGGGGGFTAEMVEAAVKSVGGSLSRMIASSTDIAKSFNDANATAGNPANTKKKCAVVLGECAQESGWFNTTKEYGGGEGAAYYPYCGRGFIQCTWEYNYRDFGRWCVAHKIPGVPDSEYFVNNITALENLQFAALTGFWYFAKTFSGKTLWTWADTVADPWAEVSSAINRGNVNGHAYGEAERAKAIRAALAVAPDPSTGGGTDLQNKLADWMIARQGKYYYTQGGGRLDPDGSGGTDCSGLVRHAYLQVAGKNIGTYTGDECLQGTEVLSGSGSMSGAQVAQFKPGDLVFVNWVGGGNPSTWDHVGMYIGKGTYGVNGFSDHGGNPNYGPVQRNIVAYSPNFLRWQVRRYV